MTTPAPVAVSSFERKSHDAPDERRTPPNTQVDIVRLEGFTLARLTFQPGWRWSEHIKPIAGTESCQARHLLYCLSGRMRVETSSGEQGEIGPGDVATIEPGHDAWVVGDEPCVSVDFGGYAQY